MYVIPAIDIIEGKCVRLSKGDYSTRAVYGDDPLEMAKLFEDAGLSRLHLVDLEGASAREPRSLGVLERIAGHTGLVVDYGGGMYTRQALDAAFSAGAHYVTCGSIAAKDPQEAARWIEAYPGRIILGADCRNGRIATGAWSEDSGLDVVDFIRGYQTLGVECCISTDIACDGMLSGPGWALYDRILSQCDVGLIGSGGFCSRADLLQAAGRGLYGAIVGKAFYEGLLSAKDMKEVEECSQRG